METTFQRKVLTACCIMFAIAIAYKGLLITGLLLGVLSILLANVPLFTGFGDEEEESEEEESD